MARSLAGDCVALGYVDAHLAMLHGVRLSGRAVCTGCGLTVLRLRTRIGAGPAPCPRCGRGVLVLDPPQAVAFPACGALLPPGGNPAPGGG